ncbi:MAG: YabP/YqfC family sporulation protein [Oscillospiraceae bacterium]|nr:YabP/YqfC family sporulation protein [Oscillospiraceae bacterium]MDE5852509.1 YabP/YqfC family sporulation protein [Oscillospiraceae bacterium]
MPEIINKIGRNVSRFLNFSTDLLTDDMTVILYSGYQAVIDGYKQIIEYDDNILRLSNGNKQLRIMGSNLVLCEMSDDGLILEGDICSAEFEKHGR